MGLSQAIRPGWEEEVTVWPNPGTRQLTLVKAAGSFGRHNLLEVHPRMIFSEKRFPSQTRFGTGVFETTHAPGQE
jgi:hypothetical protein